MLDTAERIARGFLGLSQTQRSLARSLVTTLGFMVGAWAEQHVQNLTTATGASALATRISLTAAAFFVAVLLYSLVSQYLEAIRRSDDYRIEVLQLASRRMDGLVTEQMKLAGSIESHHADCETCMSASVGRSVSNMRFIVQQIFILFDTKYSSPVSERERIDFEVTFMTRSYKDEHITVACYANRNDRMPRSMRERGHNREVYDSTVTAQVYRSKNCNTIITEDTSVPEYSELYSGQKDRIRSSIVFPVRSTENALLGTLVVHCDRGRFFRQLDRKYWEDLLELFSKRLVLEKLLLDKVCSHTQTRQLAPF